VPAVNPFIDPGINIEATDGSPVNYGPSVYTIRQQAVIPGRLAGASFMNATGHPSASNAAGTSENVAMHVAVIIALAVLGVWALQKSGFKFAVAGSIGG
jgi:hypothetical protein